MKVTMKAMFSGIALPTLLIAGIYFGLNSARASEANSAENTAAAQIEYAISSNGLMIGTIPSPLEITQAIRNGLILPIGGTFKSDPDLLSATTLRLRNTSNETIKSARLTIDWIDPQANRIFASMCGLEVSTLISGAELTGKVTEISSERMQKGIAQSGRTNLRLLIRIDSVELANNTMWQYGVMHRKSSNSNSEWIQISQNGQAGTKSGKGGDSKVHNASYRAAGKAADPARVFSWCAYWNGTLPPVYCESCGCYIYGDKWSFDDPDGNPNIGFQPFLFDIIPQGCGGYGWWECPGCNKTSIVAPTC